MNEHINDLQEIKKMLMDFNYIWDSKMLSVQKKDLNKIIGKLDDTIEYLSLEII